MFTTNPSGRYTDPSQPWEDSGVVDDTILWDHFKQGNELAFTILYKRHVHRLYNYGMHTCRDKELVLDCIQELFARLWDRRETVSSVGSVTFYLIRSFRRLLLSKIIARKKLSTLLSGNAVAVFEFMPSVEDSIIDNESKKNQAENLQKCIKALSRRQREAIFLKFFNELSYHEVAVIMDLRVDSVYNLISKAIDVLRRKLRTTIPFLLTASILF